MTCVCLTRSCPLLEYLKRDNSPSTLGLPHQGGSVASNLYLLQSRPSMETPPIVIEPSNAIDAKHVNVMVHVSAQVIAPDVARRKASGWLVDHVGGRCAGDPRPASPPSTMPPSTMPCLARPSAVAPWWPPRRRSMRSARSSPEPTVAADRHRHREPAGSPPTSLPSARRWTCAQPSPDATCARLYPARRHPGWDGAPELRSDAEAVSSPSP